MAKTYQTSDFEDTRPRDPQTGVLLRVDPMIGDPKKSRDQPVERSTTGGLNSKIAGRWDLLDTDALERLSAVLEYGDQKYGPDNWRLDPVELHLNHALEHIFRYLKLKREQGSKSLPYLSDGSIDELGHAFTRVMFALAVENQSDEYYKIVQKNNGVEK